jgi:hypothetical protein
MLSNATAIWSDPHGHVRPMRVFHPDQCAGMPDLVAAFMRHAIAPGARLGRCARISMHGSIKVGRWMPFRADQLIDSGRGYSWSATVAHGLVNAVDLLNGASAGNRANLLGLVPLPTATGPDVLRSAAGRFAAEQAAWLPGNLLPDTRTEWCAIDESHVRATISTPCGPMPVQLHITSNGALLDLVMMRWSKFGQRAYRDMPFGVEFDDETRFGDFTIPSAGRAGWWYATPNWPRGEFFRFRIDEFYVF